MKNFFLLKRKPKGFKNKFRNLTKIKKMKLIKIKIHSIKYFVKKVKLIKFQNVKTLKLKKIKRIKKNKIKLVFWLKNLNT